MRLKLLTGTALAVTLLLGSAAPALAHVTTNPDSAPKGGEITLAFRVPNELANANVVKVDLAFPTDHPLLGIDTEPIPGWTSTATETKLNPPIQTDDGPVAQAVSEIVWTASGGGTAPGQFQEFSVLVQRLPTDTDQAVFKAIQTYSDGTVVRWIDPVVAGQAAPDHPTPILALTAAGEGATTSGGSASATTATGSTGATITKVASTGSSNTTGIIGIILGALALIVAVIALIRRPASPGGNGSAALGDAPATP